MKDEPRKPLEALGDEALEARIVAWVLGEASAFEAAELEARCASDPDLKRFAERMREIDQLVKADGKPVDREEWKLSETKRRKVVDLLGVEPVIRLEKKRRRFPIQGAALAAAACLMIGMILWGMTASVGDGAKRVAYASFDLAEPQSESARGVSLSREPINESLLPSTRPESLAYDVDARGDLLDVASVDPFSESPSAGRDHWGLQAEVQDRPSSPMPEISAAPVVVESELEASPILAGNLGNEGDSQFWAGSRGEVSAFSAMAKLTEGAASQEEAKQHSTSSELASDEASKDELRALGSVPELEALPQLGRMFESTKATDLGQAPVAGSKVIAEVDKNGNQELWFSDGMETRSLGFSDGLQNDAGTSQPESEMNFGSVLDDEKDRYRYDSNVASGGLKSDLSSLANLSSDVSGGHDGYGREAAPGQAGALVDGIAAGGHYSQGERQVEVDFKAEKLNRFSGSVESHTDLAKNRRLVELGDSFQAPMDSIDPIARNQMPNELEGEVHVGYENMYEFRFVDFDGEARAEQASVDAIRQGLYSAEGAYHLGQYDQAKADYEKVIRDDPSNTAARRGLERVKSAKSDYYRAANDETRAMLLADVDSTWERPVLSGVTESVSGDSLEAAELRLSKLKRSMPKPLSTAPAEGFDDMPAEERELAELRDAVQKQEDAVEDKRKTLTTIIRNQELIYRMANNESGREGGLSSDDEAKKNAVQQGIGLHGFEEAKSEFVASEAKLRALKLDYLDRKIGTGDDQIAALEDALQKQRDSVEDKRKTLTSIMRNQSLNERGESTMPREAMLEKKRQMAVQQGIGLHGFDDAAAELESAERLAEDIEKKINQLKGAAALEAAIETGEPIPQQEREPRVKAPMPVDHSATLDMMAELSAADEAYSTFSMHVSDASFKLAAAAIERGEVPAAESVRPEEFYNAFDYGDPAPTSNEPVACAVEQCAHPAFPQRNLLRIAVRTGAEGRAQSVPLNLTLLLDNSGSMEREDRAKGLNRAVEGLSSLLKEGDTVTVAGFSRQPRLLADRVDGKDAMTLNGLVDQTPAEGGTNLEEALNLGGELAKRQFKDGAQNRVVLFTDGAANLGDADPDSLNRKVEQLRNEGIAFDAAGFGADGLNDRLLERLTRNGNGRYYVVDDAEDADEGFAKQLAGAFRPAAENVKVQVVFNPSRVGKYKLIGFEEHRLKKEDFRNDSVDAAEMASEEAGVALYQFEILPDGQGEVGEVSVRFKDTASGEMVEQTWPIPYDPQAPSFDEAKPGLQLSGLAAFVAEKLRDAPLAEAIDYSQLRGVMGRVKAEYVGNERVAQLEKMMRASE